MPSIFLEMLTRDQEAQPSCPVVFISIPTLQTKSRAMPRSNPPKVSKPARMREAPPKLKRLPWWKEALNEPPKELKPSWREIARLNAATAKEGDRQNETTLSVSPACQPNPPLAARWPLCPHLSASLTALNEPPKSLKPSWREVARLQASTAEEGGCQDKMNLSAAQNCQQIPCLAARPHLPHSISTTHHEPPKELKPSWREIARLNAATAKEGDSQNETTLSVSPACQPNPPLAASDPLCPHLSASPTALNEPPKELKPSWREVARLNAATAKEGDRQNETTLSVSPTCQPNPPLAARGPISPHLSASPTALNEPPKELKPSWREIARLNASEPSAPPLPPAANARTVRIGNRPRGSTLPSPFWRRWWATKDFGRFGVWGERQPWSIKARKIQVPPSEVDLSAFDWQKLARENQKIPPGDWRAWIILAGRGFGKTRTGAESIRQWVDRGEYRRLALIGQTFDETRQIMVEGVSGVLSVYPPGDPNEPVYESSKRTITWPNGAVAQLFGADHYESLRGPQFDLAWVDEFAKFRHPKACYDQLMMSLRLGKHPRCIMTTTPKPLPILRDILQEPTSVVTRGTTFDNQANLSPAFLEYIQWRYGHGALGRQELFAEWVEDEEGALWTRSLIRYRPPSEALSRVVVAVDPAVSGSGDETGIVVVGLNDQQEGFVLEDASGLMNPGEWTRKVLEVFHRHRADRIVAEVNQGGDLVEQILRVYDPNVPFKGVHATRGKACRAEPIAALYEQGRVFHARPLPELEDQMCHFVPGKTTDSPDRMDALVWGLTDLLLHPSSCGNLEFWRA